MKTAFDYYYKRMIEDKKFSTIKDYTFTVPEVLDKSIHVRELYNSKLDMLLGFQYIKVGYSRTFSVLTPLACTPLPYVDSSIKLLEQYHRNMYRGDIFK